MMPLFLNTHKTQSVRVQKGLTLDRVNHIYLRATYSEWINTKLLNAICELTEEVADPMDDDIHAVINLMNQSVMADSVWLKRFAVRSSILAVAITEITNETGRPISPSSFGFSDLALNRQSLDKAITYWSTSVLVHELDDFLQYICSDGHSQEKNFFTAIMHFFNHQAFVREKMISQLIMKKINFHVTDLLVPHACQLEI